MANIYFAKNKGNESNDQYIDTPALKCKESNGKRLTNVFKYVNKKSQMKTKILNKFIHKYTANIFTNIQQIY